MIKIISDIEKSEYNPKNYNLKGNVLDTTNFRFTYNDKIYDYIKYEIKNNENEKDVAIHIYSEEQGPIYINPRHEESSFVGVSECFEKLNKEEITLDFFNELKEANLVPNSLNYDDIYANNHKEFFSKQYKDEKETDFFCVNENGFEEYDESSHYSGEYLFKLNNNVYKLDILENEYPNENFSYYGKFNLSLCDLKTGNEKMVFSIIEDNNKKDIVCDKNLLDKDLIEKINLKDIRLSDKDIQKANDLQCEINSNHNIYKINIDDKTYTIKNVKNGNENNVTIENENGKKIYEEYNILNNIIQRFDKNELTKEVYDNIILANSSKIISFPYDYICKSFTDISSQKEICKENIIEAR